MVKTNFSPKPWDTLRFHSVEEALIHVNRICKGFNDLDLESGGGAG
jgi:hypothetical protein